MKRIVFGFIFCLVIIDFYNPGAQASTPTIAPSFALPDLEGKDHDFKEILKGNKAVLINFWATWCPSCREEIPQLVELQKKFSEKHFAVIGVDVGELAKKAAAYKDKYKISYLLLLDGKSEIAKSYGVVGLPTSILVGSDGRVIGQYREYSDELEKDVEKNL